MRERESGREEGREGECMCVYVCVCVCVLVHIIIGAKFSYLHHNLSGEYT